LGFREQTALPGKGLTGPIGVVHNSGSCRVQIGCCSIQAGISFELGDEAAQVLSFTN